MLDGFIGFLWRVLITTVGVIAFDALGIPKTEVTIGISIFLVFLLFLDE